MKKHTTYKYWQLWGSILGFALGALLLSPIVSLGEPQSKSKDTQSSKDKSPGTFSVKTDSQRQGSVEFDVTVEPKKARRGSTVKLTIAGKPKDGWYTYSFTKRTPDQTVAGKTYGVVEYPNHEGVEPLWPIVASKPTLYRVKDLDETYLVYKKPFTLTQELYISRDASVGRHVIPIELKMQVCKSTCLTYDTTIKIVVEVTDEPPASPSESLKKRLDVVKPDAEVVDPATFGSDNFSGTEVTSSTSNLLNFILAGIFWGAVSLITPCVFPMIPITVSYFLKQSESENHRPIVMATIYCATIIFVLTIAAVAFLSFFRALSTNAYMNFVIGGLFIFFALSLFGWYDIELPSGLARFTSSREGQGGYVGTIFMALTFTIISFACVAPFLGGFGGTAANSNLTWAHRIFGGLAFSITFASPFFVLALFPVLLKKMPKSGSWLNAVKVTMGFLELAAAIKFLRAGELLVTAANPTLFTYDFSLGLYVAISFLAGLYLLGFYRLPHDSPLENLSVPRMLFSFVFIALGFYLMPGLFKRGDTAENVRPDGQVFAWLDSFLLPEHQESGLPYQRNLDQALLAAQRENKLVFVDFTGVSCTNCKLNEQNVFAKPSVRKLLKQYELVALYTDVVPEKLVSEEEIGQTDLKAEALKNLAFQKKKFNTEELPLYVILRPKGDGKYEVLRQRGGLIQNEKSFKQWLSQPLQKYAGKPGDQRASLANQ